MREVTGATRGPVFVPIKFHLQKRFLYYHKLFRNVDILILMYIRSVQFGYDDQEKNNPVQKSEFGKIKRKREKDGGIIFFLYEHRIRQQTTSSKKKIHTKHSKQRDVLLLSR